MRLKNEQDLLGQINEEEDLALMRGYEDDAAASRPGPVDDDDKEEEEDDDDERGQKAQGDQEDDEDDEVLLDMMDDIDDDAMYAAMVRRRGSEEEDRPGSFGGLRPGFLRDATPKARPPPPVVVGDVRERTTQAVGAEHQATEAGVAKKPVSRFKMSLNR